ncbi:putative DNA binding domain-containing protein [Bifidobacterium amazonense]|uniref:DNA binding domain-containing protein n=1 Tax=Bifidobacterium amazonense TaxID=2809027 RepID=A0ABS9VX08_9BIFI|nr:ATP-binding protein [Bifidobacterium amazonense]MCH9276456.1 putative DNA binding domain-containing protein [Bifidobacterium amazonense]
MWTEADLDDLLEPLRSARSDDQCIEVKESVGKLPASLAETISAFANGNGGTVTLGLSESNDFAPAAGFKPQPIAEALAQLCRDKMIPPLHPSIEIVPYRGSSVVIASIDELDPLDKPCYVATKGRYSGSFIRVWDGDRKLSSYEIDRLMENRVQPAFDRELIEEADPDDLLTDITQGILALKRRQSPRIFGAMSDDAALHALGVTGIGADGRTHPTLAGLLVAGNYPQQFLPRLNVTFACYPGYDKAGIDGVKFIDNRSFDGPVPEILNDVLSAVSRNMRIGGVLDGPFRKDTYEYPQDAVREAVVNAVMHRDYSPMARGGQIQVNMYKDRLEILSIGGLYGNVTPETIGEPGVSSTRNQTLAKLLESTPFRDGVVAENRGTGFDLIDTLLQDNGNGSPLIQNSLTMFSLTFHSADTAILPGNRRDPEYAEWGNRPENGYDTVQTPSAGQPTRRADVAGGSANTASMSESIRRQRRKDIGRPLVMPFPGRRRLTVTELDDAGIRPASDDPGNRSVLEEQMLHILQEQGTVQTPELMKLTGAPRSTITYQLRKLLTQGVIERTQPARSPKQSYRLRQPEPMPRGNGE